jgi:hypothetical protein
VTTNTRRVLGVVVLAIAFGSAACSAPGAGLPGASGSGPPQSTGTSSPSASPSKVVATSTPDVTSTAPVESDGPSTASPASDAPIAVLAVGSDRYAGEVGGFTFGTYSQSAPWLPASALGTVVVPAGAELSVELDDRATIAGWTARQATAADVTADTVTGLAEGDGPTAAFGAPAVGDWVVSLTITYGDGLGSGAYYWHIVVE